MPTRLEDFSSSSASTRLNSFRSYETQAGDDDDWGKAGSMPLSLQPALLSCSGAGFSGEGLPLDSQCIGGENICREN
ncbi:hypothetical protein EYF80_018478 [Liparis tanakae]|uniref:Uncharacterized protein n=1 Tax=Liparis tanakae TaxID=230148 RepID=A0A4Z2HZS1_9TELE|nr:hypothetical protein EYF80_018478 [Liparis tanakae]